MQVLAHPLTTLSLSGDAPFASKATGADGLFTLDLPALLYVDDTMLSRPLYMSQPTNEDGRFQLSFPAGGNFYLAARNSLGGTPAPDELYGRYQWAAGAAFKIETGQAIEGLRIVVEPVW